MKEYLDFDLEIREGGPQEYPVAVDSPGGQAEERMRFPFDDWDLENKLLALENALLRSGGSRRGISVEEQTVQEFGERLFKAVLTGDIRTRYEVSLRLARQQNKGLRLKLHIRPPKLALLPWEFLYDPDSGEYLCFSSSTPLVRYVDLRQPVEQLPVTPPLRILGMVASPTDLPRLDVEHEKWLVEEAIKVLRDEGMVELTWLEGSWRALQEAMWHGPWHVFHFVGHGDFDPNSGKGRLAFSNETTGRQEVLAAKHLARLLDDHYGLRLAFLNSCEGARGGEGDPFSGTASTLVRRGVPAVVAMQYEITDRAAIAFSRAFYHAVANGLPVDAAVAAARTAVSINDTLEWGTPVLYMRSPDGRLFDIKKEEIEEEGPLGRYREHVQAAWTSGELHEREAEELRVLANELGLSPNAAADIERKIMGETKEAILGRREQAAKEQYRRAVEISWVDSELSDAEAKGLEALADKLGLSTDTTDGIEREVIGDTVPAILQRRRRLDGLYTQARQLHQNREWQAVLAAFEQIRSEAPAYPDPEGLLKSAHEALQRERRVVYRYDRGRRHAEAEEWREALACLEEVQRLESGYRDTEALLFEVRHRLAPPRTVEVPDLTGHDISRARSRLASEGLKLGACEETSSDTIPEGELIEQRPEPGAEVPAGSPVSITVSSGPREVIPAPPDDRTREDKGPIEVARPVLPESVGSKWALVLRGVAMGIFGLVLLLVGIEPGSGHFQLYGALLLIADGVFATIDARTRVGPGRLLSMQGRIGVLAGVFVLLIWLVGHTPIIAGESVKAALVQLIQQWAIAVSLVGTWAIFIGALRTIAAIELRGETKSLLLMGTSGVLMVFSGILLWSPSFSSWRLLGFLALASGLSLVAVALRARAREASGATVRYRRA
jgi:uncharacterized membrane protein HdeD (DUF308 family)